MQTHLITVEWFQWDKTQSLTACKNCSYKCRHVEYNCRTQCKTEQFCLSFHFSYRQTSWFRCSTVEGRGQIFHNKLWCSNGVLSKTVDDLLSWDLGHLPIPWVLCTGDQHRGQDMRARLHHPHGNLKYPCKQVKFSHTRYQALRQELIPVYRQSAYRWPFKVIPRQ